MNTKEMLEGRIAMVKMALDNDDVAYTSYLKLTGELRGLKWALKLDADKFREEKVEDTFPERGWVDIRSQRELNALAIILESHGITPFSRSSTVYYAPESKIVSWWEGDYLEVFAESVKGHEFKLEDLV